VQAKNEISVLKLLHEVLRPGSQDEAMVVAADGRLEARRLVLSVDKDGSLLVRSGLAPTDKLVVKPRPEAKPGDIVSIGAAGTAP
ncbi:MAG TPA: hypothetical protein VEX18_20075, partial [Polyangiaceae bacterium]|nr:hypothetical protein [Polyangiaceae bacterium]